MGKAQSKDSPSKSQDTTDDASAKSKDKKQLVPVEEVFVQKIAYKCGVTDEELNAKKEVFQQHAGGDPMIGFEEFKALYRDISGRQEDDFLNAYVESIFRAFDADKDAMLTFREWQVGFYLLLLLPSDANNVNVNKEDFLLALEIIFRLYDGDSNNVVTKKEIAQISSIITQPEFAAKFDSGTLRIMREVDTVDMDSYAGGVTQEEFLNHFSQYLK